jgi:hypothetical protein
VSQHRAIGELDDAVDQRLGMNDHVDPLVGCPEEMVGLHHLEALVHQGRRIDRDLAAHRPGRMVQGLLDGYIAQFVPRASAEGPAAGGDREPVDRAGRLPGDQLVQGRVLGVDRHDPRPGCLCERADELTAHDQGLLVGKSQVDPLPQRRDGRTESGRADECVQHQVGFGFDDQAHESLGTSQHAAVGPCLAGSCGGVGVGQCDPLDTVRPGLLDQLLPGALSRQPDQLELLAAQAHVEGLATDRAGRAEDQ